MSQVVHNMYESFDTTISGKATVTAGLQKVCCIAHEPLSACQAKLMEVSTCLKVKDMRRGARGMRRPCTQSPLR